MPITWQGHTYEKVHVDEMNLAVLHPDHSAPERILCSNMQDEVSALLQLREKHLAGEKVFPFDKDVPAPDVGRPRGFGRGKKAEPRSAEVDYAALDALA